MLRPDRFLYAPKSAFSGAISLPHAFLYLIVMAAVGTALSAIVLYMVTADVSFVLLSSILGFTGTVFLTPLMGAWLTVWGRILGAKKELVSTVLLGTTPYYLLGWLTVVPEIERYARAVLLIWVFILYFMGLRVRDIPRPGITILLAVVSGFAILGAFAWFVFTQWIPFLFSV